MWGGTGEYVQNLKGGDLVLQHLLGFVEVGQHVLRLPAVGGVHLRQLPLVPLHQLLLVRPEETRRSVKPHGRTKTRRSDRLTPPRRPAAAHDEFHKCFMLKEALL